MNPLDTVIFIDPGITGAMAVRVPHMWQVHDLPVIESKRGKRTIKSIDCDALRDCFLDIHPDLIVVEQVRPNPQNGAIAMFSQGLSMGSILGCAAGFEVLEVSPTKWKKDMGLTMPKGTKDGIKKEVARQQALIKFPALADRLARKKDHNRADALLIGAWYEMAVEDHG